MIAHRKPTLLDVCRFLRRNAAWFRAYQLKGFARWVGWYWTDARAAVVRSGGQVVAVALARCLDDAEHAVAQSEEPFYHNERGKIVWVQDIVSRHPQGIPALLGMASQRFGPREAFAGRVFSRAGELRMLPWKTVERLSGQNHPHEFTHHPSSTSGA